MARGRTDARRWSLLVCLALGLWFAVSGGPGSDLSVSTAEAAAPTCPRVVVLGVRGSGQRSGFGQPVWDVVNNVLPEMRDPRVHRSTINYPSVPVTGGPGALLNQAGAFFQISGPGVGAYHDSVVKGKNELRSLLRYWSNRCHPDVTRIVLVGYSQGAQVAADVYQEMWRANSSAVRSWVSGLVLFGDPYFNPASPGTVRSSGFSGSRWGALGMRPRFPISEAGRIRSYCHARDPVCQGPNGLVSIGNHSNYHDRGEAADAGRWLSTRLRAWIEATPWPPAPGSIVRNPDNGASWLITPQGYRNWIPTGGDWLCLRARGAPVVSLKQAVINTIPDRVGIHATCTPPPAVAVAPTPAPQEPATPAPPKPYAGNLVAVNYGGGHVGVAFDVGWQAGRDPVVCHFFRNGVEVFTAQCGTRSSKQFYDLPPGRHTFHATVSDQFGIYSDPTNSATVEVSAPAPAPPVSDRLSNDGRLAAASNQFLRSSDGRYRFVMQSDSNLVLYGPSGRALWASNTVGRGANHLRMQGDGNLVIYNGANAPLWASNTPRNYSAFLVVQNDGNVVIYNGGVPVWATGTAGRT